MELKVTAVYKDYHQYAGRTLKELVEHYAQFKVLFPSQNVAEPEAPSGELCYILEDWSGEYRIYANGVVINEDGEPC